jgi:esterase/lipase superfamily enzyme
MLRPASKSILSFATALFSCLTLACCGGSSLNEMTASIGVAASGLVGEGGQLEHSATQVFVASTRRDSDHKVGGLHETLDTVTVPPGHAPGRIETPVIGAANPRRDFTLAGSRALDEEAFARELASHISGRVGTARDLLLFVHGFNTSLDDARFRIAQVSVDARFSGIPVLFAWPTQSSLFTYAADKDRAAAARDLLADFLLTLAATPGVGRVHVLAHSMGGWLTMEALHQDAIAGHPDLDGRLGEVMLAAPDIDLAVFRQQMRPLVGRASVSVIASRDDRALNLSSKIAGDRPRLGALDPSKPAQMDELRRLGVAVYDVSSYSRDFVGHGIFASAPPVIATIGAQLARPRDGETPSMAGAASISAPPSLPETILGSDLAPPTRPQGF